jgi:hypothetical protein
VFTKRISGKYAVLFQGLMDNPFAIIPEESAGSITIELGDFSECKSGGECAARRTTDAKKDG